MRNFINFLHRHESFFEKSLVYFICFFLFCVVAPHIFSWLPPVNSFLTTGITKLLFRAFGSLVFVIFVCLMLVSKGIKLNIRAMICCIMVLAVVLFSIILTPRVLNFSYIGVYGNNMHFETITLGLSAYVSAILEALFSFFYCYVLFFVLPKVISNKFQLAIPLMALVGLMVVSCLYSYIFEFRLYIRVFGGGSAYVKDIRSIFVSKNDFGQFLLQAEIACIALVFLLKNMKFSKLFWIPLPIFFLTIVMSMCKTALLGSLIVLIGLFLYFIFSTIKTRPKLSRTLLIVFLSLILFFALFMAIPAINELPVLKTLYNYISKTVFQDGAASADSRFTIWSTILANSSGPNMLIGYGPLGEMQSLAWLKQSGYFTVGTAKPHNSFVSVYLSGGLVYLSFYVLLFVIAFKKVIKGFKNHSSIAAIVFIFLITVVFYSFSENFQVFISGNGSTFILDVSTILLISTYDKFKDRGVNENEEKYA